MVGWVGLGKRVGWVGEGWGCGWVGELLGVGLGRGGVDWGVPNPKTHNSKSQVPRPKYDERGIPNPNPTPPRAPHHRAFVGCKFKDALSMQTLFRNMSTLDK